MCIIQAKYPFILWGKKELRCIKFYLNKNALTHLILEESYKRHTLITPILQKQNVSLTEVKGLLEAEAYGCLASGHQHTTPYLVIYYREE